MHEWHTGLFFLYVITQNFFTIRLEAPLFQFSPVYGFFKYWRVNEISYWKFSIFGTKNIRYNILLNSIC